MALKPGLMPEGMARMPMPPPPAKPQMPELKKGAVQRRLNNQGNKDKTESPEDQKKIAAAQKIIKEQQQIIYDLQHNGK